MTRAKWNKNYKIPREKWIDIFRQQTNQVSLLMNSLDHAFRRIQQLEEEILTRIEAEVVREEEAEEDEEGEPLEDKDDEEVEGGHQEVKEGGGQEEGEEEGKEDASWPPKGRQQAITGLLWCGTSLSDQALSSIDCSLQTRFSVRKCKAFTINASGASYRPEVNAELILSNQFQGEEFLVLEIGVNEVTNACGTNFEEDKAFIRSKMKALVDLAQDLCEKNNLKQVVLLNRLIRCDNPQKVELSRYSDIAMEKEVNEKGNRSIVIRDLPLKCSQELLFGFRGAKNYKGQKTDNLHFRGSLGVQAFTHAAISLLNSL